MLDWNVAVYCANEGARLRACLASVIGALSGFRAAVTVVLNGSHDGSRDAALAAARLGARSGVAMEAFAIPVADKANAINQFHYRLRVPARAYAAVDGYAVVGPGTFRAMAQRFAADPHAVALAGLAVNGRTEAARAAATLATGGRLPGQLHAFRPEFLDRMVARGLRLPVGLYRGDGLLGSMAAHDLDPLDTPWDDARIPGVAGATFQIPALSPFRPADLRRHSRRKVRQMRGAIENAAIRSVIYHGGYEALPGDADELIRSYLTEHGAPQVPLLERPLQHLALRQHKRAAWTRPDPAALLPRQVAA